MRLAQKATLIYTFVSYVRFNKSMKITQFCMSQFPFQLFQMTKEEKLAYYEMAMKKGLERFLIPDNFTSVGKMRVKTPKYNTPKDLYSDDTMDDMVCGSTVE